MKTRFLKSNNGFTLIETMVAVFILTLALTTFLSLNANSLFSSRYARNEVTANYLIQEAADYIRNDRDNTAFLRNDPSTDTGWVDFLNKYGYNNGSAPNTCFASFTSNDGCYFEVADSNPFISSCSVSPDFGTARCPTLYYDDAATNKDFYTYHAGSGLYPQSAFKRQILMQVPASNPDELDVKITVEWKNGTIVRSRSLVISLLNWQKNP